MRANVLEGLPEDMQARLKVDQIVRQNWTIEQGALALACIKAGVRVQYLDGTYNSWGGDSDFHILHCFKSLYRFDRRSMLSPDAGDWIAEYLCRAATRRNQSQHHPDESCLAASGLADKAERLAGRH